MDSSKQFYLHFVIYGFIKTSLFNKHILSLASRIFFFVQERNATEGESLNPRRVVTEPSKV